MKLFGIWKFESMQVHNVMKEIMSLGKKETNVFTTIIIDPLDCPGQNSRGSKSRLESRFLISIQMLKN